MTDVMQLLYTYILESRVPGHIDQAKFKLEQLRAEKLCEKLVSTLPEPELHTIENSQLTLENISAMESEAVFQAALRLGRELT